MPRRTKKISRDIEFLYEIGSLRHLQRSWRQFTRVDVANNSEHIFRVIWIALIIARREGVKNEEKIIKLALVHDVGETRVPDTNYLTKIYSSRDEAMAMSHILKNTSLENDFHDLYKEYAARSTIEAKIVKDADNLDVDFELAEMKAQGHTLKKYWPRTRVRDKLFTKTAKKIWEELQSANPHEWHIFAHEDYAAEMDKK
ncbi:MAG: HD domain-containing protein [Patescibacteria group bacterium]